MLFYWYAVELRRDSDAGVIDSVIHEYQARRVGCCDRFGQETIRRSGDRSMTYDGGSAVPECASSGSWSDSFIVVLAVRLGRPASKNMFQCSEILSA